MSQLLRSLILLAGVSGVALAVIGCSGHARALQATGQTSLLHPVRPAPLHAGPPAIAAVAASGTFYGAAVIDANDRAVRVIHPAISDGVLNAPAWSPSNEALVMIEQVHPGGSRERTRLVVAGAHATRARPLAGSRFPADEIEPPSVSPGGRYILHIRTEPTGGHDGLYVYDGRRRRQTRVMRYVSDAAWSPDGRSLALGGDDGRISIFDLRTRRLRRIARGSAPAWSPDSRALAFINGLDYYGTTCFEDYCRSSGEVYRIDVDGTGLERLTHTKADEGDPAWSPDGRWIAYDTDGYGNRQRIGLVQPDGSCPQPLSIPSQMADWDLGHPAWRPVTTPTAIECAGGRGD